MALPKLLQKLFTNGGAGDKLNQDIIPDIPYSKVTDAPVVDSALSSTSENPVQNKVIKSALDGKLSLTGGIMTDGIAFNKTTGHIIKEDKNGYLALSGGNNLSTGGAGSAILWLCGGDATSPINRPGAFSLEASKGTWGQPGFSSYDLLGKPDGSLTWGGHNVISVVSESYITNKSWYRKYSDGWIEQGGESYFPKNVATLVTTFPIAFTSAGFTITFCSNSSPAVWLTARDLTNFSVSRSEGLADGPGVWWVAYGK